MRNAYETQIPRRRALKGFLAGAFGLTMGLWLPKSGITEAQTDQLTNQQNTLDSQVSAYGTFTSALDTLKLALPPLEDPSQLAGFAATVAGH